MMNKEDFLAGVRFTKKGNTTHKFVFRENPDSLYRDKHGDEQPYCEVIKIRNDGFVVANELFPRTRILFKDLQII